MSLLRPRTSLGRAVLPVVGGAIVIAAILGGTWAVAAWISRGGADSSERLAPSTFAVGDVESVSEEIAESGPLLFPDLNTASGRRTLVLDHEGDDADQGWRLYWAYPADADPSCAVEQIEGTDRFVDCNGRQIGVTDLALPAGTCPIVEDHEDLSIGMRPEVCGVQSE